MSRYKQILGTCFFLLNMFAAIAQPDVSIAKFAGNRQAAISLTFDDGIQENFTLIAPHLDSCGLKGTFGINGKFIGDLHDNFAPRMTWDECRQLLSRGHEINNHTWSHPNLYYADPIEMAREIEMNDSAMIAELGTKARSVMFPFNAYNDTIRMICEKGKVGSRLSQFALGQRASGCSRESINHWLNDVIRKGDWGITMTHGIFTAWDQWNEPNILWEFFRTLSDMNETVWVDTFVTVQAYVKERDTTKLSTAFNHNVMTIIIDCPLDPELFDTPLTLNIGNRFNSSIVSVEQDTNILPIKNYIDYLAIDVNPHGGPINVVFFSPT